MGQRVCLGKVLLVGGFVPRVLASKREHVRKYVPALSERVWGKGEFRCVVDYTVCEGCGTSQKGKKGRGVATPGQV